MKELTIKQNYNIAQVSEVIEMAKILKQHIIEQKLYTPIVGKNYVHVEGWQFAGGLLGLFPTVKRITNLSTEHEIKWQAEVVIFNSRSEDAPIISRGFAICSNKEGKKKSFDEYAILSMAQTRAIGKSYRNLIGWVMKLAGYESTPAEEMEQKEQEAEINNNKAFELLLHKLNSIKPEKCKELAEKALKIPPFPLTNEQKAKLQSLCQNPSVGQDIPPTNEIPKPSTPNT